MRKSFFALLLFVGVAALTTSAFAEATEDGMPLRLSTARMALEGRSRAAALGLSATAQDTIWVGYSAGPGVSNYWSIGAAKGPAVQSSDNHNGGKPRPGPNTGTQGNTDGLWTFDHPVHGDSLQGWWPVRELHTNASGGTLADINRPWWAAEVGNQANYVLNEEHGVWGSTYGTKPGDRTFGVIGVWHSDPGNTIGSTTPGTNPHAPAWGPFHAGADGNAAWMGLRGHGDLTVVDPITHNPFNQDVLQYNGFNGSNTVTGNGTSKHFPGYGCRMDQLMYRDFSVDTTSTSTTIDFDYRTAMSTDKDQADKTRTGWFEGDPILLDNSISPGNFISAEAGTPATTQAPCDSFQVYIGQGEEGTFHPSTGGTATIYDPLHRWFNEVLNKNNRLWLMGVAGTTVGDQHATLTITAAQAKALAGHTGKVRLVFRVHTNGGFDDENIIVSTPANYNSGYVGAVELDNVKVNSTLVGDFSTAGLDFNNDPTVSASSAWKSTGKPPAIFMHVVDVNTLLGNWDDLCGGPNGPYNVCNLWHNTISVGDKDHSERNAGAPKTPEHNGRFGCISPTINLVTPSNGTSVNGWNLNTAEATPTEDFYIQADLLSSLFDVFTDGDLFAWGAQCYPVKQSDGTFTWGEIRNDPFIYFFTDPACTINGPTLTKDQAIQNQGMLVTSNTSGVPDSIRIFFYQYLSCYRFGVPDANCGTSGKLGLFDNMGMAIVDGAPAPIAVDIWFPYNDTFPFNDDPSAPNYAVPGTAAFDTTSALMRIGLNISQSTGDELRFSVPGDSVNVKANGAGDSIRVDMLFRINPGPGNYVTAGNVASGLRKVPTSAAAVTSGDGSFWDMLKTEPGSQSSGSPSAVAQHAAAPSGFSSLVWNSARCDTQKTVVFSSLGDGIDATGGGQSAVWMSTFHEAELLPNQPKRTAWVLSHKRPQCFVIDTTVSSLNAANVQCGSAPGYMTALPHAYTGWTGDVNSSEGVSILPDGIFTPGTHIEYFFRRQDLSGPNVGTAYLCPDTTVVMPQAGESSFDGHRWFEVNVLPDKWKGHEYDPSTNQACMLYVDNNDRRGDELAWTSVADTIGATRTIDRGNNNGYAAPGGTGDQYGHVNDASSRVFKNKQAGTTWDMYGVKASESIDTGSGGIGSRLSYLDHSISNLTDGKDAKFGPSPLMLSTYYRMVMLLSGDLNLSILGPFANRSGDDVGLLENYLLGSTIAKPYGLLAGGNGFVEDNNWNYAPGDPQYDFDNVYLGVDLNQTFFREGYRQVSANPNAVADLVPAVAVNPTSNNFIYAVQNFCTFTLDNLAVINGTTTPNAVVGATYENVGGNGPYIASVVNPGDSAHPWKTEAEGWDIYNMRTRFGLNTNGRAQYMYQVFTNVFGSLCTVSGTPLIALDVPTTGNGQQFVDFVGNFTNNPLRTGVAVVRFGLAQSDRVEVDVYDVSGRQIRKLADRMFPAGEHTLTWDGVNDRGQLVPRGVYFTQVKYVNRHVTNARKLTVLK